MLKTRILILLLLCILAFQSNGQGSSNRQKQKYHRWELGATLGGSSFLTSYNPEVPSAERWVNFWNRDINPGIGLSITHNLNQTLGIDLNYFHTKLSGTWNNEWPPHSLMPINGDPLTFNSTINQFELFLSLNIVNLIAPRSPATKWDFYLKAGPGVANINDNQKFYNDRFHHYYNRFSVAAGLTASYQISYRVKLKIGTTFRMVNTDNLDGLHQEHLVNGVNTDYLHAIEFYNYTFFGVSVGSGRKISKTSKGRSPSYGNRCR